MKIILQDLPNNMIHQVSIKTLPQEWLWCETWCDDSSKKYAKTIDLVSKSLHFFNYLFFSLIDNFSIKFYKPKMNEISRS